MKDSALSVGLKKTKWNLQAIYRIRFWYLHSSRKNFSYLLVSSSAWSIHHHTNDQSVSYHYPDSYARLLAGIQHRCQYYEHLWRAQGRLYSTTPLYFSTEFCWNWKYISDFKSTKP